MRNIWIIAKRELYHFFYSPIAYVVYGAFYLMNGFFYSRMLFELATYTSQGQAVEHSLLFRYFWQNFTAITLIFLLPAMTMHLFAEEKRSGTLELLLTKPLNDWEVVLGKFLAAMIQYTIMIAGTLIYLYILMVVGKPDLGPVVTGYLGILLVGASFISLGILASSLTSNQIIAVIVSFALLLLFWLLSFFSTYVGALEPLFSAMSLSDHFESFGKGMLDGKDIIFYLSFIFFNLFVTTRIIESHKWR